MKGFAGDQAECCVSLTATTFPTAIAAAGNGRWLFADGVSYFEGSYERGGRRHGHLVMFDSQTKKQLQSYTGG